MTYQDIVKKSLTALVMINAVLLVYGAAVIIDAGHWQALRFNMMAIIAGRLVLPFTMLPGTILIGFMNLTARKNAFVSQMFFLSSFAYYITLLTGFALLSAWPVSGLLQGDLKIAAFCWAVAAGVSPWLMVAMADRGNYLLICMMWFMMLASVAMVAASAFFGFEFGTNLWGIGWVIMALCLVWQSLFESRQMRRAAMTHAALSKKDSDILPPV